MSRFLTSAAICLAPLPALAHPGHIAASGGHDHWVAGAAIALAVGIAVWNTLRDRRRKEAEAGGDASDEAEGEEAETEPQEA